MTDDQLLEKLFQPARELTVADDGFTQRVMEQIPRRQPTLLFSRLWTVFCIVVATLLFVAMNGWGLIALTAQQLVCMQPTQHTLLMLIVSATVVGTVIVGEVVNRERLQVI